MSGMGCYFCLFELIEFKDLQQDPLNLIESLCEQEMSFLSDRKCLFFYLKQFFFFCLNSNHSFKALSFYTWLYVILHTTLTHTAPMISTLRTLIPTSYQRMLESCFLNHRIVQAISPFYFNTFFSTFETPPASFT